MVLGEMAEKCRDIKQWEQRSKKMSAKSSPRAVRGVFGTTITPVLVPVPSQQKLV